jgi:hypothetical protein
MKNILVTTLLLLSINSFSQTGVSLLMENNTTKNQQTITTNDFNKKYEKYLRKSERQSNISTTLLVTSTIITTSILMNVGGLKYDRFKTVALTNVVFIGLSTTFKISSNNNRRKAYELKRNTYL